MSFKIPCTILKHNIPRELCELGASISLIPLSRMKILGGKERGATKKTTFHLSWEKSFTLIGCPR